MKRRRLIRGKGTVQGRKFPVEHPQRPAIGDDMVNREEQKMFIGIQRHQDTAKERNLPKIERPYRFFEDSHAGLRLFLFGDRFTQIDVQRRGWRRRMNDLYGRGSWRVKRRAKRLMTPDDLGDCSIQRRNVDASFDSEQVRNVIGSAARLPLVEEPE